eukprot:9378177-Alexandrium_andersonii.AAC.1
MTSLCGGADAWQVMSSICSIAGRCDHERNQERQSRTSWPVCACEIRCELAFAEVACAANEVANAVSNDSLAQLLRLR